MGGGGWKTFFSRLFSSVDVKAGFFSHTILKADFFFHKALKVRFLQNVFHIFRVEARFFSHFQS